MKHITIDRTDLTLSPIGLGTAGAGLNWDGAEADRLFDAYLDMGGNLIDTAHVYSDWVGPETARSERVIGDWLGRSGKRSRVVLATKGGHPDLTAPSPDLHKSRMTGADMAADLDASLRQLRTDCIDLYFYHRDDPAQPVEALIEVMEGFVKAGKIRCYGCSNWSAERMEAADRYCLEQGYRGFAANQALLNLGLKHMSPLQDDTMRAFDPAMTAYHRDHPGNLAMPYMGICGGFFHRWLEKGEEAVRSSPYYSEGNLRAARQVRALTEKYGATVSQVVLGFFGVQAFACVPLFGPRNIGQLREAMETAAIPFRPEDYQFDT